MTIRLISRSGPQTIDFVKIGEYYYRVTASSIMGRRLFFTMVRALHRGPAEVLYFEDPMLMFERLNPRPKPPARTSNPAQHQKFAEALQTWAEEQQQHNDTASEWFKRRDEILSNPATYASPLAQVRPGAFIYEFDV